MDYRPDNRSRLKTDALAIFEAALAAVDPAAAVERAVRRETDLLLIRQANGRMKKIDLRRIGRVFLVGAGKATAPMARAMENLLGDRLTAGVISVKTGHGLDLKTTRVMEAAHPVPDQAGVAAATKILALVEKADQNDLVVSLISGGGSALLPLPVPGVTLSEKQAVTRELLACGAAIQEINCVRKHLSRVKGGQLALAAAPARVVNLMLSDVIGDDIAVIGSGPFAPDPSTFHDADRILTRYGLMEKLPPAVASHLQKGLSDRVPETPKADHPCFKSVTNLVVGSNLLCLKAAEAEARKRGYRSLILSSQIEGETREAAVVHAGIAKEIVDSGHPLQPPACVITGGETTVTLRGRGKGGRNQEFALAAALRIQDLDGVVMISAGTDGTDGPTDAAGALADGRTCRRAEAVGLSARDHLENNDAYPFFQKLGDLILTGPTRTNVMDIRLILVDRNPSASGADS